MTEAALTQVTDTKANNRYSGILVHPTSFPSKYGIGDLGQEAYTFIDYLVSAGQTLWQILPLGPTGYGDSPYQCFSAFAGQPLIISPDKLLCYGLLTQDDLAGYPQLSSSFVDYGKVIDAKTSLFERAFQRFRLLSDTNPLISEYTDFCIQNAFWLEDYSLFMALKSENAQSSWLEWREEWKNPAPKRKDQLRQLYQRQTNYFKMIQFLFFKQWFALKRYANDRGIKIIGDIPIFVSLDSADVWANQSLFQLDAKGFPTVVAGVPPDYFSATGQLWGNPLYNWDAHAAEDYGWWISRIKIQLKLVDYIRIDHFRGFISYWAVPYGNKTAVNGKWLKGPKAQLFHAITNALGNLPIWAEDLGVITEEVKQLREQFRFPGMKILQFAFEKLEDNDMMPEHHTENCICYTGTHDNDTSLGWYLNAKQENQTRVRLYMHAGAAVISWAFVKTALESIARYVIIPLQDILSLDSNARMNRPGHPSGNWTWRYSESDLDPQWAGYLKKLTLVNHRHTN